MLHTESAPGAWVNFTGCGLVGIACAYAFVFISQYYTDFKYKPVRIIAEASTTGHGTNIIAGVGIGMESTALPVVVISIGVCLSYWLGQPSGLVDADGKRVFETRALIDGNFEAIVSGYRKGTGSSRETAAQCERWSGIRYVFAASFAPIHERNNLNLGQLMGDHAMLARLQAGEALPLSAFTDRYDPVTRTMVENGGLFAFAKKVTSGEITLPANATGKRPMTMAEKIAAKQAAMQQNKTKGL